MHIRRGHHVLRQSSLEVLADPGDQPGLPVRPGAGGRAGGLGGAQSELLAVPAADFQLLRLPAGIDAEQALLLTDNLPTGWAAAQRADFQPGETVVVLGLGAVGLCAVLSALTLGAATVFAIDPVEGRRLRAERLGATAVEPPALQAVLLPRLPAAPAALEHFY